MKTIIASGYFDPIHVGHIEYLNKAATLGERLVVIVNNDKQCVLKKGKPFQNEQDRLTIVRNLKSVYRAFLSTDDDRTVCKSIREVHAAFDACIFAKGGDRTAEEIPEAVICQEFGIEIVDGLGDKIRSSSELINRKPEPPSIQLLCSWCMQDKCHCQGIMIGIMFVFIAITTAIITLIGIVGVNAGDILID